MRSKCKFLPPSRLCTVLPSMADMCFYKGVLQTGTMAKQSSMDWVSMVDGSMAKAGSQITLGTHFRTLPNFACERRLDALRFTCMHLFCASFTWVSSQERGASPGKRGMDSCLFLRSMHRAVRMVSLVKALRFVNAGLRHHVYACLTGLQQSEPGGDTCPVLLKSSS